MHKLTFFPLGNADCCRIDLADGSQVLIDYAAMRDPKDKSDPRIDLPIHLRLDLAKRKRDFYDVVAFTHLDDDHIHGASEFFWLQHAEKYQGTGRVKIHELWVPAAAIIEEGCEDESRIIRQEARHRLVKGEGIRVFSRPDQLKEWLEEQGLSLEERQHLITDAGQLVPGWTKEGKGVEFFVHSPFASRLEDGTLVERNKDALVLHATFLVEGKHTRVFFGSDIEHEVFSEIIRITLAKKRDERLQSDVVKIPHHSSYLSLGPERGETKTVPTEEIARFYEKELMFRPKLVSTSWPIPAEYNNPQPPHRQAANYYQDCAGQQGGEYIVTMEHPSKSEPQPLVIEITGSKASVCKPLVGGTTSVITQRAPRAGRDV